MNEPEMVSISLRKLTFGTVFSVVYPGIFLVVVGACIFLIVAKFLGKFPGSNIANIAQLGFWYELFLIAVTGVGLALLYAFLFSFLLWIGLLVYGLFREIEIKGYKL